MPPTPSNPGSGTFAPTRWTLVLRAQGESAEAQAALGELCSAYYQPVFRFLCRERRNDDTARELTQEFFARLLARRGVDSVEPRQGRFRSFLLGAVKHFLADVRDRGRTNYPEWCRVAEFEIKPDIGRLIGADRSEIAFVKNTTEGLCIVASGIDWRHSRLQIATHFHHRGES